jgi:hypothetical protein
MVYLPDTLEVTSEALLLYSGFALPPVLGIYFRIYDNDRAKFLSALGHSSSYIGYVASEFSCSGKSNFVRFWLYRRRNKPSYVVL